MRWNSLNEYQKSKFSLPLRNWLLGKKLQHPKNKDTSKRVSYLKQRIKNKGINKNPKDSEVLSRLFISNKGSIKYEVHHSWNDEYLLILESFL